MLIPGSITVVMSPSSLKWYISRLATQLCVPCTSKHGIAPIGLAVEAPNGSALLWVSKRSYADGAAKEERDYRYKCLSLLYTHKLPSILRIVGPYQGQTWSFE